MEALYAKLYNRYTRLKNEKDSQLDEINREQEVNFLNYVAAADELIEYLKNENDGLARQVTELQSELSSIRSSQDEQQNQYEMHLLEEKQKNKELYEEIARLQKLEHNVCSPSGMEKEIDHANRNSQDIVSNDGRPAKSLRNSARKSAVKSSKKRKTLHDNEGKATSPGNEELDSSADRDAHGERSGGAPPSIKQPPCCQRKIDNSGSDADNISVNCIFQYLIEFVVGMKFSALGQSDGLSIRAYHQSSGYSFSLTWITNSHGETELCYQVLSLGAFVRVAPEWMKDTVIFGTSMCRIFFEKVSRVLKS